MVSRLVLEIQEDLATSKLLQTLSLSRNTEWSASEWDRFHIKPVFFAQTVRISSQAAQLSTFYVEKSLVLHLHEGPD